MSNSPGPTRKSPTSPARTRSTAGNFSNAGILHLSDGANFTVSGTFANSGYVYASTFQEGSSTNFTVSGPFTNYNTATKTLTDGSITVNSYAAGSSATFVFPGADIRINQSQISLNGPNSKIANQSGGDALANLTLNDIGGGLFLSFGRAFVSAGNFVNAGELGVSDGGAATISGSYINTGYTFVNNGNGNVTSTFRVLGAFTNYNPVTKTLAGGGIGVGTFQPGAVSTFQFPGADIYISQAGINLDGPDSSIIDENGLDGLRNFVTNGDSGFLGIASRTFLRSTDFTNDGYIELRVPIIGTTPSVLSVQGTLTNNSSGTVNGQGEISADRVINEGVIRAAGDLTITAAEILGDGSFEALLDGILRIEADTVIAGDILVSAGGRIEINSLSVTASSLTIADGGVVVFGTSPSALLPAFGRTSPAVPEPGSAALLMVGLAGWLGGRKRSPY